MASTHAHHEFGEQLRYLNEWFRNFSALQKSDFLPIMVQQFGNRSPNRVNGLPPILNDEAQPDVATHMSIFQCRVKLFLEWSADWNHDQRECFLNEIRLAYFYYLVVSRRLEIMQVKNMKTFLD